MNKCFKKNILVLNRGTFNKYYYNNKYIFDKQKFNVHFITDKKKASTAQPDDYTTLHTCDLSKEENIINLSLSLHNVFKFDHILTFSELEIVTAAKIRAHLNIEGLQPEIAIHFRDKCKMKSELKKYDVRVPEFLHLEKVNQKELIEFFEKYNKVVIKPHSGAGSVDTYIIDNKIDLINTFEILEDRLKDFEIEEFISGIMYHVDTVIQDNKIKLMSASRYSDSTTKFLENRYLSSVMEDDDTIVNKISDFNKKVLNALNYTTGISHMEIFITENDEIVFCEIGARMGGAGVNDQIRTAFGLSLSEATVLLETGDKISEKTKLRNSGWIIFHPKEGQVQKKKATFDLKADWILKSDLFLEKNQLSYNATSSTDLIARFVVSGLDKLEVQKRLDLIDQEFENTYEFINI